MTTPRSSTPAHTRRPGVLRRLTMASGALGIVATVALAAAPVANAADVEREKHGSCSANSRWELNLEREHGVIEIDADVDTPRAGQTWVVRLKHNGTLFTKVTRVTDREGEFEVDRRRTNQPGEDRIKLRAVNRATGEVCVGVLSI
jgi:hypothetical protein